MTAWASLLVPAGAVAIGGVVTGASAIWTQVLVHRVTSERERESRRDTFMVKRFETERDTLLALYEAVYELHMMHISLRAGIRERGGKDVTDNYLNLSDKIAMLANRTLDKDAAHAARKYGLLVYQRPRDESKDPVPDEITTAWAKAMECIGSAIRRDPFSGRDPWDDHS